MITFTDKNGREVQVKVVALGTGNGYETRDAAEDILLRLLQQVPKEEYVKEPSK